MANLARTNTFPHKWVTYIYDSDQQDYKVAETSDFGSASGSASNETRNELLESISGKDFGSTQISTDQLTLGTSTYAAGDQFSDRAIIQDAVRSDGSTAILSEISVIDKSNQRVPFDILFFNEDVSPSSTKNNAFSISDANLDKFIGVVQVQGNDYVDLNSQAVATISDISLGINPTGSDVYVNTIIQDTGTYASDAVSIKTTFLQD